MSEWVVNACLGGRSWGLQGSPRGAVSRLGDEWGAEGAVTDVTCWRAGPAQFLQFEG